MVRSNATPVASADANSAGSIFLTSMSPDKPCGWIWAKARVTAWCPSVIARCEYLAEARPKLAAAAGEAAMFLDTKSPRLKPRLLGNHISRLIRRALRGKADGGHTLRHAFATGLLRHGCNIRHTQAMLGHVISERWYRSRPPRRGGNLQKRTGRKTGSTAIRQAGGLRYGCSHARRPTRTIADAGKTRFR